MVGVGVGAGGVGGAAAATRPRSVSERGKHIKGGNATIWVFRYCTPTANLDATVTVLLQLPLPLVVVVVVVVVLLQLLVLLLLLVLVLLLLLPLLTLHILLLLLLLILQSAIVAATTTRLVCGQPRFVFGRYQSEADISVPFRAPLPQTPERPPDPSPASPLPRFEAHARLTF